MNIGFIHYSYPGIGGTETVTDNLATFLESRGHYISVISWKKPKLISSRFKTYYLPDESNFCSEENNKYIERLANKSLDCIINQGPFWIPPKRLKNSSTLIVSVLHYAPNFKVESQKSSILEVYENRFKSPLYFIKATVRYWFKGFFSKRDFKRLYCDELNRQIENSDRFVVLCDSYISQLNKITHQNHSNIVSIPNGLIQPQNNINNKGNIVVYIGRLSRWDKRVDRLLKIWSKISVDNPDWKLLILGNGPDRNRLEILAKELAIKNCSFEGFVEVSKYLQKASVICLTSSSEGFPMVLLEAMSYGVVPIAYNVSSGIDYIINDKINGYLINPFDEIRYTHILDALVKDGNKRSQLSENAVKSASQFTVDKMGNAYLQMIKSGIDEKRREHQGFDNNTGL